MKQVKCYCLLSVLFLTGCSFEKPLFKDEDAPKANEGTIVFNMYKVDPRKSSFTTWLLFGETSSAYVTNYWKNKDTLKQHLFVGSNHLKASGVNTKYVVARVPAGTYFLNYWSAWYKYYSGNMSVTVNLTSPSSNYSNTPFKFSIKAGEVKYLGDIEIQSSKLSDGLYVSKFIPFYKVHNNFDIALEFISSKYPSIANKLKADLIQKTDTQLMLEARFLKFDVGDLLKDVEKY